MSSTFVDTFSGTRTYAWGATDVAERLIDLTGGGDSHTHTQTSHTHTQAAHTHTLAAHTHTQAAHTHTQNAHAHTVTVASGGALPPYYALCYIMKL